MPSKNVRFNVFSAMEMSLSKSSMTLVLVVSVWLFPELADGLEIDLNKVPLKYRDWTVLEIAISGITRTDGGCGASWRRRCLSLQHVTKKIICCGCCNSDGETKSCQRTGMVKPSRFGTFDTNGTCGCDVSVVDKDVVSKNAVKHLLKPLKWIRLNPCQSKGLLNHLLIA